jgi:hypothetical protein
MYRADQLSLGRLRIVSQPKSLRNIGYVSAGLKFFDSALRELRVYETSTIHREECASHNGLFFELCLGSNIPPSLSNSSYNKHESESVSPNDKKLHIVLSVQIVSAKYISKEKNHVAICVPHIKKRKSAEVGKKEEHFSKLIDIHSNSCKICSRGSGRCKYAERFKAISHNVQNEVVFYLKILHDCHTLELNHFNLLFRAIEKSSVSEFQRPNLSVGDGGTESAVSSGTNTTVGAKILGVLSDPFFVGDPQLYHFHGNMRQEVSSNTLSLNSLLFSKNVDVFLSDSEKATEWKYIECEKYFTEDSCLFNNPVSHWHIDCIKIIMFLSSMINTFVPLKLQQNFWTFVDKHLNAPRDCVSQYNIMNRTSDRTSNLNTGNTFDILLSVFEGHTESTDQIQQLVINLIEILEMFIHSPEISNHADNNTSDVGNSPQTFDMNVATFQNADGETLLHYAASAGYYRLCEWLLSKGMADVNTQNLEGNTPLHCAINNRFRKIAVLLLENKAKTDVINLAGETPRELLGLRFHSPPSLPGENDSHRDTVSSLSLSSHSTSENNSSIASPTQLSPHALGNTSNNNSNVNTASSSHTNSSSVISASTTNPSLALKFNLSQRTTPQPSSPRKSGGMQSPTSSTTTLPVASGSSSSKSTFEKEFHSVISSSSSMMFVNQQQTTSQYVSQTTTTSASKQVASSKSGLIHSSSSKLPKESANISEKGKEKVEKEKIKDKIKAEKEKEGKDKTKEKVPSVTTTNILKLFPKIGDWLKKKKKQIGTPFSHTKSPKPSEEVTLSTEWQEILETAGLSKQEIESNLETFQQLVPPQEYLPSHPSNTSVQNDSSQTSPRHHLSNTPSNLNQFNTQSLALDMNEFNDSLPVDQNSRGDSWEATFSTSWDNVTEDSLSESLEKSQFRNSPPTFDLQSFSPSVSSVLSTLNSNETPNIILSPGMNATKNSTINTIQNSNDNEKKINNNENQKQNGKNKKLKSCDEPKVPNERKEKETNQTTEDIHDLKYQTYPEDTNLSLSDLGAQTLNPTHLFSHIRFLAEGEKSELFVAQDNNGQRVILKKYQLNICDIHSLINEVNILRTLCIPENLNLITFRGCYFHGEEFWIATDFVEGLSLSSIIEDERKKGNSSTPFNETQIAYIISQLLRGLTLLHNKYVVHRDFNSDSILLTSNGDVKIVDFTHATQLTRKRPRCNSLLGQPHWVAPEMIRGVKYDCKVDVWALGLVLILLFDGKLPYEGFAPLKIISMIERSGVPSAIQRVGVSPESVDFARLCLNPDPTLRPTAPTLLNHPFLRRACTAKELSVLMEQLIKRVKV